MSQGKKKSVKECDKISKYIKILKLIKIWHFKTSNNWSIRYVVKDRQAH